MSEMGQYSRNKMHDKHNDDWHPQNRRKHDWFDSFLVRASITVGVLAVVCMVATVVKQVWFR